jgi:hypothetical protein
VPLMSTPSAHLFHRPAAPGRCFADTMKSPTLSAARKAELDASASRGPRLRQPYPGRRQTHPSGHRLAPRPRRHHVRRIPNLGRCCSRRSMTMYGHPGAPAARAARVRRGRWRCRGGVVRADRARDERLTPTGMVRERRTCARKPPRSTAPGQPLRSH